MTAESETPSENPAAATGSASGAYTLLAQYIKDLSFEAPNTPRVFTAMQTSQPDIDVNIDVGASKLQDEAYEVLLTLKAECKADGDTAFILELVYGGLVRSNLDGDVLRAALLIETPRNLFPFARNIAADVTRDGGFPPLMLAPMDFAAMHRAGEAQGDSPADITAETPAAGEA